MGYLETYPLWLSESHKLLTARPESARISTKYHFSAPGKATFVLKTYDPVSGSCLKYKTDKAAEVGRLVTSLGGLGKRSLGLDVEEEILTTDDVPKDAEAATSTAEAKPLPTAVSADKSKPAPVPTPAGGQQSGKKKKKGKK